MGLKAIPMEADTGPIGGNLSHEFIILAETGESEVFCDREFLETDVLGSGLDYDDAEAVGRVVERFTRLYARTDEKHDPNAFAKEVPEGRRYEGRGIEVGHIFYFGEKYSAPLGAKVATPEGHEVNVHMGSYGIGVSRLAGGIIEASHDEDGIVWPDSVAPFDAALINLKATDAACTKACDEAYEKLQATGLDPLYEDTDERAGAKFAEMDLIGLPWQVIVGPRGLERGVVELKRRATGQREEVSLDSALARLTGS
jgi:prolyl-tRNA synthetase